MFLLVLVAKRSFDLYCLKHYCGDRHPKTNAHKDGFLLVLLGCAIFVLFGAALEHATYVSTLDFRVVYYSTRSLLEGRDPYQESKLQETYRLDGGEDQFDSPGSRKVETQFVYPPTAFSVIVPFALLGYGPAHLIWLVFTAASVIMASLLMWEVAASYAPLLAGFLIFLSVADSELFIVLGNPAGVAVSFCVIAAWTFVRQRFVFAGILCLAISLMLRPHDAALVWLYFLAAGRPYRKYALQTLGAILILSLPAILWLTHLAPTWPAELHANLSGFSVRGGLSDPGPSSQAGHGIAMIISLQSAFSILRDDPHFYNLASYLVCGVLLLPWLFRTLRSQALPQNAWLALATIAPLSMLPIYHRLYDAKLLLLTVPACAMLWKEGRAMARPALVLSAAGILLTESILWAIVLAVLGQGLSARLSNTALAVIQVLPVPTILLIMGSFYLWVYLRHSKNGGLSLKTESGSESENVKQERDESSIDRLILSSRFAQSNK